MRGLLRKDWYMILTDCRASLIVDLVFVVYAAFVTWSSPFFCYPFLFAGFLPMTLLSVDEKERWQSYCAALPVATFKVVAVKYFVGLAAVTGMLGLEMLMMALGGALMPGRGAIPVALLLAAAPVGLLPPALMLPLMFRYGAAKARVLYLALIGGIVGLQVFLFGSDGAPMALAPRAAALAPLLCLSMLALYAASFAAAVFLLRGRRQT